MLADPRGERRLVHVPGGDGEHGQCRIGLRGDEPISVESKEQADAEEGSALVAVDKRVILREADAIRGGQIGKIRRSVRGEVLRPCERGCLARLR